MSSSSSCTTATTLEEELYFGSVTQTLAQVPGTATAYTPETITLPALTPELAQATNQLMEPCAHLGPQYDTIILPAVPGVKPVINNSNNNNNSLLPSFLQAPLQKSKQGNIVAVQSGVRSALLKDSTTGKWYRLKGCGNNYDGFPIAPVKFYDKYAHCFNIRGCAFAVTCPRELYYSAKVNTIVAQPQYKGMPNTNVPVGFFEYQIENDPYPKIAKMCAVYETMGDKRLNDHVIAGLETLIDNMNTFSHEQLLQTVFSNARFDEGETKQALQSSWWHFILTRDVGSSFADCTSFAFDVKIGDKPQNNSSKYDKLWNECVEKVNKANTLIQQGGLKSNVGNLLGYLYWRFGREIGTFLKLLHDNNMSWGTYIDSLGDHCNAHPNNFVLMPEGKSETNFLAYVDLDMAFARSEFCRPMEGRDEAFDQIMQKEVNSLKLELAGAGANSGIMQLYEYKDGKYDALRWALRDTLIRACDDALEGKADAHPLRPELQEGAHALLKLALIVTSKNIA